MARGGAFAALVLGNLVLALGDSAASGRLFAPHRRTYWIIALAVVGVLVLIFSVPAFASVFKVARPDLRLLGISVAAAVLSGGWIALGGLWRVVAARSPSRGGAQADREGRLTSINAAGARPPHPRG